MASATVTNRRQNTVLGSRRQVVADAIAFANNGDTWVVPGIKRVETIDLTPTTNASFGFTVSGATITLVSGGAVTFLGGASGI